MFSSFSEGVILRNMFETPSFILLLSHISEMLKGYLQPRLHSLQSMGNIFPAPFTLLALVHITIYFMKALFMAPFIHPYVHKITKYGTFCDHTFVKSLFIVLDSLLPHILSIFAVLLSLLPPTHMPYYGDASQRKQTS